MNIFRMGSTKTDDYESQLSAAFSSTPLMFNTSLKPPPENPPQVSKAI